MDRHPHGSRARRRLVALVASLLIVSPTLAQTAPSPVGEAAPVTAVVQTGDTLYSLARRHGTTIPAIMAANGLATPAVRVGQTLVIPGPAPSSSTVVAVAAGDTLYSIARRFGTTVDALSAANALTDQRLEVGQLLAVPAATEPVPAMPAIPSPASARAAGPLLWPVQGRLNGGFGYRAMSGGPATLHTGLDIGVPAGTPILAAAPGRVVRSGWDSSGYGLLVVVRGTDGRNYYYAHTSRLLVEVGQEVARGATVALVGSTGNSTGPHVHFEMRVAGVPADPIALLPAAIITPASRRSRP